MKWAFTKSWGMILLGIWLILNGLNQSGLVSLGQMGMVLGILAIVAGILVLIGR